MSQKFGLNRIYLERPSLMFKKLNSHISDLSFYKKRQSELNDKFDHSNEEDQIWAQQLIEGKTTAFDKLYSKYASKIYGFFKKKVKSEELVNDLNQMTWERVYTKIHMFDIHQKFSSWLYTLATNILIDEIRKKSRTDKLIDTFSKDESLNSKSIVANEINSLDLIEDLNFLLKSLPELAQEILEMRYLKEMSFEQIAEIKNLSQANVRKIISRSLKSLKNQKEIYES